jgi:hypothetical protein
LLACLASKSWGWKKHSLRRIFTASQRTIMDYASAAWQPFLSESILVKLGSGPEQMPTFDHWPLYKHQS